MNVLVSSIAVVCLAIAFLGCGGSPPSNTAESMNQRGDETADDDSAAVSFETALSMHCRKQEECNDKFAPASAECERDMRQEMWKYDGACESQFKDAIVCISRFFQLSCEAYDEADQTECNGQYGAYSRCLRERQD